MKKKTIAVSRNESAKKRNIGKSSGKGGKRGRPPEVLKIAGDWKDAVKQALKRGKPTRD